MSVPFAVPSRFVAGLALAAMLAGAAHAAPVQAIGVENEYADVIAQIGGRYVSVSAIEDNPNTDPHTFEASPSIARRVAAAQLVVRNGLGYDDWVEKIMSASPNAKRRVIDVQTLLGLPDDTANPHLWYDPKTMPRVAQAVADALSALDPAHAAAFHANADTFVAALKPWTDAIASFAAQYPGVPVATTEPVSNDMLEAAGMKIMTPFNLQKAIMDGTDPAPQDVTTENALLSGRTVRVFAYNQQVTDQLTDTFKANAKKAGVPIVGVYETMPVPGYHYQSWMLAEMEAVRKAVAEKVSTERLGTGR